MAQKVTIGKRCAIDLQDTPLHCHRCCCCGVIIGKNCWLILGLSQPHPAAGILGPIFMAVSRCGVVDSSWHDLLPRMTATTPWTTDSPAPPPAATRVRRHCACYGYYLAASIIPRGRRRLWPCLSYNTYILVHGKQDSLLLLKNKKQHEARYRTVSI